MNVEQKHFPGWLFHTHTVETGWCWESRAQRRPTRAKSGLRRNDNALYCTCRRASINAIKSRHTPKIRTRRVGVGPSEPLSTACLVGTPHLVNPPFCLQEAREQGTVSIDCLHPVRLRFFSLCPIGRSFVSIIHVPFLIALSGLRSAVKGKFLGSGFGLQGTLAFQRCDSRNFLERLASFIPPQVARVSLRFLDLPTMEFSSPPSGRRRLHLDDEEDELSIVTESPYFTQPTQVLEKPGPRSQQQPATSSPRSIVEVPASSPFKPQALAQRAGRLANFMAPAGTTFRAPARKPISVPKSAPKREFIMISDDELDAPIYAGGDSSDDDAQASRGDIRPSSFRRREPDASNGATGGTSRTGSVGSAVSQCLTFVFRRWMSLTG